MDWNRDGKTDAKDATLYHALIRNDESSEHGALTSVSRMRYAGTDRHESDITPVISSELGIAEWMIAVTVITVLFLFL